MSVNTTIGSLSEQMGLGKGHAMNQGQRVKHDLHMSGSTLKRWAQENGFPYRTVSDVVRGVNKATYGAGYEVAVALGLKRKNGVR